MRTQYTADDVGCLYDSHNGHYIVPEIIRFAKRYGYNVDPFVAFALSRYDEDYYLSTYPSEGIVEESESAIQWLNDNIAPEGYYFGWNDGDFGFYQIDEEES